MAIRMSRTELEAAEEMGMVMVTDFINPRPKGETQWGRISNGAWLEKERERIGGDAKVIEDEEGYWGLARMGFKAD